MSSSAARSWERRKELRQCRTTEHEMRGVCYARQQELDASCENHAQCQQRALQSTRSEDGRPERMEGISSAEEFWCRDMRA
eukprot:588318-Rhodomonas_salina.1